MTRLTDIHIRDPFILKSNGKYYLYGTRSETAWSEADGFDVYVSEDLHNWSDRKTAFQAPKDFWATRNFWAPECIEYRNKYYMAATFGGDARKMGIQILQAEAPEGPFRIMTKNPITPEEWNCLDGTLFVDQKRVPWLVFSHSAPEEPNGTICAMQLDQSLTKPIGEIRELFQAKDAPWACSVPFAKEEFGIDGEVYLSDGPYLFIDRGKLLMLWSSWGSEGYSMGIAVCRTLCLTDEWEHRPVPLVTGGGHGMILADENHRYLVYHSPNVRMKEHPVIRELDL